jgi:hypothetical protein
MLVKFYRSCGEDKDRGYGRRKDKAEFEGVGTEYSSKEIDK